MRILDKLSLLMELPNFRIFYKGIQTFKSGLDQPRNPIPKTLLAKIELKESGQWPEDQIIPMNLLTSPGPLGRCQAGIFV
jgi:hypothetical protein